MPTTTDIKKQPLSRMTLRKSPRETPEEFERRSRQFNDLREFKMKNFPRARVNLVLPREPLLLTNIVKHPATPCNQQRRLQFRPQMIFTKGPFATSTATDTGVTDTASDASTGSVAPELTATAIDTPSSPVSYELTATAIDTPSSPVSSELTATAIDTSTSPLAPELNDKELVNTLQERNPALDLSKYLITQKTHLDFAQYLIQAPRHQADADTEKMAAGIIQDLLDNLELCDENGNNESKNESSETGIKATKFQRFRRNLKSLKTRIVRAMTPLTSCFSLRSIHTAD